MVPHSSDATQDELSENAVKIAVGVAGSILSIVVIAVLTLVCAYCCVVKYKMCTPIHDPTQEMPYRYNDTNTNVSGSNNNNNININGSNANNVNSVNSEGDIHTTGDPDNTNGHDQDEDGSGTGNQEEYDAVERQYENRELIIEAPPNYHERDSYPFFAISLPSYESLYSSTDSLSNDNNDGSASHQQQQHQQPSSLVISNNYRWNQDGSSSPSPRHHQQGWVYHNPIVNTNVSAGGGLVISNTNTIHNDTDHEHNIISSAATAENDVAGSHIDDYAVPDYETVVAPDAVSIISYHVRFEIRGSDSDSLSSSDDDEDI